MTVAVSAADWLHLDALKRHPTIKIALSEGSIGWIPYFLERADFPHERHHAWMPTRFDATSPSELLRKHFLPCFIDDAFSLQVLKFIGEDMIAYECDEPHSDSLWPNVPERLYQTVKHLTVAQIDKVTHRNAMRFFRFDPFKHHRREELTVSALQAEARAAKIDVTPKSYDGATPLSPGEKARVVTSGDMAAMMAKVLQRPPQSQVAAE